MTHPTPELLSGYLDNALPAGDRDQVELHLSACAECRTDLVEVRRLQRRRGPGQTIKVLIPLAAAAAVLLVVVPRQSDTPSDLRSGSQGDQVLEVVSPDPAAEVAGPVTFVWRSAGAGANYTLTLQEADGRIAWVTGINDTVVTAPDSVQFGPGHTWFWTVDALLPDGQSRSTGVQRLRTRP